MFVIVSIVSLIFFLAGFSIGLVYICKRLISVWRIRKYAKVNIGDEVSIHHDKGAKLAYKGICAHLSQDHSKALVYLEKAMKYSGVSHNSAFCLDWMSKCYEALEKPAETLSCRIKAVEIEPSNVKSLFNLADMYVRNGAFSKAEFYYKRILRYDKENLAATFMLGTLFMGRGLYSQAEEQFLKTLEMDNESEAALTELSVVMAIKGDYSRMDSYFDKAKDGEYIESDRLKKRLNSIKKMKDLCNDY
jgi:tetratricopeptide (TPR) repeat protein